MADSIQPKDGSRRASAEERRVRAEARARRAALNVPCEVPPYAVAIPLTGSIGRGLHALVDPEVLDRVSRLKWHLHSRGYACATVWDEPGQAYRTLMLHAFVAEATSAVVDHINGNKLDNTRRNLRPATTSQNGANSRSRKPKSGYRGVYRSAAGTWQAQITVHGEKIGLGHFETDVAAAHAYDRAALEHFKEFARLNFSY